MLRVNCAFFPLVAPSVRRTSLTSAFRLHLLIEQPVCIIQDVNIYKQSSMR